MDTEIRKVAWVSSKRDVMALLEAINSASAVVYDLETTGLDEHAIHGGASNGGVAARVSMAGFTLPQDDGTGEWDGVEPVNWVVPLSHPHSTWLGQWRKLLTKIFRQVEQSNKYVVGHHVKFDNRWVYALTGIDLSDRTAWDTMLSSSLLDENTSNKLKDVAPEVFGVPPWDDHDLSYPGASEDVDLMELGEYQYRDTYWTWRLYQEHREQLRLTGEEALIPPMMDEEVQYDRLGRLATWVSMPTVATLSKVEQRGMQLDADWVRQSLTADQEVVQQTKATLKDKYDMDGDASLAATSKWFLSLTEKAVEQGELEVTARTKTGKPQWSKAILEKQARRGSETAELILAGRNSTKRSEYLQSWLDKVSPAGTIHATYNAGTVVTGRLSSSGPNMQQVTGKLKPAFMPREGYYLAEIDYSQIELRVAAHVSQCAPMIDAFNRGDDLHRILGAKIANKSPEDVTKDERQKAKSANFGLLYGMGAPGFQMYAEAAYGVDVSLDEAFEIHQAFFDQWDGIRQWHQKMARIVGQRGEVTSPIGRVRHLPNALFGDERMVSKANRDAVNSPVQGFASDLMQMAASSISGTLPGFSPVEGAHVVATVHDSIVVELDQKNWRQALRESLYRMTQDVAKPLKRMGCVLTVPLAAEAVVGSRWGLDDIKTEDQEI